MLSLFQSNHMPELARAFCERNAVRQDPFEPTTVVVQSFGIGQWLKIQMAKHQGIASNIDCILPATFLWRLYQQLLPEANIVRESPYNRDRLIWRIMRILKANPGISGLVTNYLNQSGDADLRLYQLCYELALLFDEYLMYRPDWIEAWESGSTDTFGHAAWQSELWRLIVQDLGTHKALHRAQLHQQAMTALRSEPDQFARHINVFGLSTMPPLQLETFQTLAKSTDVDVYFLNPCAHYWGDVISPKEVARRSVRALVHKETPLVEEDYLNTGNPILSSLGKQGREFFELLLDAEVHTDWDLFVEHEADNTLNIVKNDILNMTIGGEIEADPDAKKFRCDDSSLQIHICHSRIREVETLHDQLLHLFNNDSTLKPHDILVMMPDVSDYEPFIRSVFSDSIAFRVADQSTLDESGILGSFFSLVSLGESRLTAPEVMDLLEVPAVMRRFEFTQDDLETLSYWINAAGIRWESTGNHKSERWNLPANQHNTWQFGLDRLLLGIAMDQGMWQDNFAHTVSPHEAELLGKLGYIIEQLTRFRELMDSPRTMSEWQQFTNDLLDTFYEPRDDELLDIGQLRQQLEQLTTCSVQSVYEEPVSVHMFKHSLRQALTIIDSRAAFISGGVTFATLVPMRSIPFRVIALLGMNDGEYPRDARPHSFDLIASGAAQKGDRSKRQDDRYLFLEALLSALDVFYVSYIGKGSRDNKDRPPSVVVTEWRHYLDQIIETPPVFEHALQPFHPKYYRGDRYQSFDSVWFEALNTPVNRDNLTSPLPMMDELVCTDINQLCAFFRHPAKYFLQQRLGVYFEDNQVDLRDSESFELDNLERFQLADEALGLMVRQESLDDYRQQIMNSGLVMSGIEGEHQINQEIQRAAQVYASLVPHLSGSVRHIEDTLTLSGSPVYFQESNLYGTAILSWRAGRLRARQLLVSWIRHLSANALDYDCDTLCVHQGEKGDAAVTRLLRLDRTAAQTHLEFFLKLYEEGIRTPLFLPPEACKTYAEEINKTDRASAMSKLLNQWDQRQPGAEGQDRYWRRVMDEDMSLSSDFTRTAVDIWQPLLEAMTNE